MARIAVLVSNPCTGDARVIKMAEAAAEAGHDVHVFATSSPQTAPFEVRRGVTYHRLAWRPGSHLTASAPLSWIHRIARPVSAWIARQLVPFMKYRLYAQVFAEVVASVRPDIVHAHDLICLPAGHRAAQITGARLIYDAHELELHRNPPLTFFMRFLVGRIERKHGRRADAVITVGRLVGQELAKHLKRTDIDVIYNAPVIEPCANNIRKDLRLDAATSLVIYVGKVTEGRGVKMFLELMPQFPDVVFAAVGPSDPRSKAKLEASALRHGLADRFHILPPVPPAQVVDYIRGADVGIISVEPVTLSYRYCMPNKLFEMSFADIPILSNELDEIAEFLAELGNGTTVDFERRERIHYSLAKLLTERQNYKLSEQSRLRLQQAYSWEVQAAKLCAIYDRVKAKTLSG